MDLSLSWDASFNCSRRPQNSDFQSGHRGHCRLISWPRWPMAPQLQPSCPFSESLTPQSASLWYSYEVHRRAPPCSTWSQIRTFDPSATKEGSRRVTSWTCRPWSRRPRECTARAPSRWARCQCTGVARWQPYGSPLKSSSLFPSSFSIVDSTI